MRCLPRLITICCAVALTIGCSFSGTPQAKVDKGNLPRGLVDISAPGTYRIQSTVGGAIVAIKIVPLLSVPHFPAQLFWGADIFDPAEPRTGPHRVIQQVSIQVGERELSVPVGSYLGIINPTRAAVSPFGPNRFRLGLLGRTKSGSIYSTDLEFDTRRVLRMSRGVGEFPYESWGETRYESVVD